MRSVIKDPCPEESEGVQWPASPRSSPQACTVSGRQEKLHSEPVAPSPPPHPPNWLLSVVCSTIKLGCTLLPLYLGRNEFKLKSCPGISVLPPSYEQTLSTLHLGCIEPRHLGLGLCWPCSRRALDTRYTS